MNPRLYWGNILGLIKARIFGGESLQEMAPRAIRIQSEGGDRLITFSEYFNETREVEPSWEAENWMCQWLLRGSCKPRRWCRVWRDGEWSDGGSSFEGSRYSIRWKNRVMEGDDGENTTIPNRMIGAREVIGVLPRHFSHHGLLVLYDTYSTTFAIVYRTACRTGHCPLRLLCPTSFHLPLPQYSSIYVPLSIFWIIWSILITIWVTLSPSLVYLSSL